MKTTPFSASASYSAPPMKHPANEAGGEKVNHRKGEKMGTKNPGCHRMRDQKEGWGEWRVRRREERETDSGK